MVGARALRLVPALVGDKNIGTPLDEPRNG